MSTMKDSINMTNQSVQPESNEGVLVEDKSQESMATTSNGTKMAEGSEMKAEREAKLSDLLRVFSYAESWDFILISAGIIASIGVGVTMPLMLLVVGLLVGKFSDYLVPGSTGSQGNFESVINRIVLYMFILFIARFVFNYINKFSFRIVGIRLSAAIKLHYLRCLFAQTVHVLDTMAPGTAANTITTTGNTLQLGISENIGIFIEAVTTIIAAAVVAFTRNVVLTLVTFALIVFIVVVVGALLPFIVKGMVSVSIAEMKSTSIASESFSGIRMIAACGAEERVMKRFAVWADITKKNGQKTAPLLATQYGVIFFCLYSCFALSFWYGIKLYAKGRIDNSGSVLAVIMLVTLMAVSVQRVATPMIAMSKAIAAACEFFTLIDAPLPQNGELKAPDVSAAEDIVFNEVDFAYPSRPQVKVLDGLNLKIEAGQITAIVGPSGSGKSTLVGLIERWYSLHQQPTVSKVISPTKNKKTTEKKKKKKGKSNKVDNEVKQSVEKPDDSQPPIELKGTISTCGRSLDEIDLKWWRSQIGLVQQEPFLFNDTIYGNVAHGLVGSPFENISDEQKRELVIEACKESYADEFVDRLPDRYDTFVGDGGVKLSGGQRQRISIARAVIKKPRILILDEATSAIDVRGELVVQAALDKVSQGRTTIVIAHRLSTIKKAAKIVVLKEGRVVEYGTHESLLSNNAGAYYDLVSAQKLHLGEQPEASDLGSSAEDNPEAHDGETRVLANDGQITQDDEPKSHIQGLVKSFGRLLYEQRRQFFLHYVMIIVLSMATGAAFPLQSWLIAQVIAVFQYAFDPAKLRAEGNFWSLMWFVLAISTGIAYFLLAFISTNVAYSISVIYRQQYFRGILYQKMAFFDAADNSLGTLTARVNKDPKQLEELLGMNMAMIYNSIFTIIGSVAIAFAFGWKLALVAVCVAGPIVMGAGYFRLKYELEFEKMYSAVFAESSKFAAESIGAFRTVTSLTLENSILTRYDKLLSGHVLAAYKRSRWTSLIFAFSDSVSLGCQALVFWYGGRLLVTLEYQLLDFLVCYIAVIIGAESAGLAFSFSPNAARASAAANRILNHRESCNPDLNITLTSIPDANGGVRIEFKDVQFKYPTRDISVFDGLNLTIEKGQFAALVGASGCGKTSIISLLERFYDIRGGTILANGVDIAGIDVQKYRKHLSLVAQEPTLLQGTVRENILLGVDPETVADQQLEDVCRDASINDFIKSLPEGFNTDVGSKGVSLSGGQKQRISIARALIRQPDLLLLDEATSSLDSNSEKLVQEAFERAARGRTMIVVAHRLATVQNADVIFVLGDGKVLEKGNHTELLKKGGVYWNMCQSQALDI